MVEKDRARSRVRGARRGVKRKEGLGEGEVLCQRREGVNVRRWKGEGRRTKFCSPSLLSSLGLLLCTLRASEVGFVSSESRGEESR